MDACVDDFLNEIDGMIPSKQKEITKISTTKSCDWEECFDDTSGFPYYWNVSSNEVTWEVPAEYKKWKALQKKPKPPQKTEKHRIYKPETQLLTAVHISQIPDTIIYKIGEIIPNKNDKSGSVAVSKIHLAKKMAGVNKKTNDKRKRHKSPDDSEDEKITLISSYGGDSESENDDDEEISRKSKVILATKDVQNKITSPINEPRVTGIALLANYGESDDEDDIKQVIFIKNNETNAQNREKLAQSTLFPIQQLIDASQFDSGSSTKQMSKTPLPNSTADDQQKVYQRKRRIGLELPTKKIDKSLDTSTSRTGLGFNSSSTEKYANFKSAGAISFVKSDSCDTLLANNVNDVADISDLLKEKIVFLCEGKEEVSPVQIMLIQLETLQTARLAGCIQSTYLQKWLQETNEEITKLEKDSTPDGWLLEWDREQKRYSYRHLHTGHAQWEYPADRSPTPKTLREPSEMPHPPPEDMDISTTPPPLATPVMADIQFKEQDLKNNSATDDCQAIDAMAVVEMEAPPPPMIGRVLRPVPPPPPILTEEDMLVPPLPLMPEELPPPPPPPPPTEDLLPPSGSENPPKNTKDDVKSENLNTVLDSFYSDIAAIESSIIINNISEDVQKIETSSIMNAADVIPVEVKKRKKLKMSQGLSMKKKGVSKLVEKWKNVQKNLD